MLRLVALVLVLIVALFGYKQGMDGGEITVLIVVMAVFMAALWYLKKKYGVKRMLGGVANGILGVYDPTLPSPVDIDLYQEQEGPNSSYDQPSRSGPVTNSPQNAYLAQPQHSMGRTYVQEIRGPEIQGALTTETSGRIAIPPLPIQSAYTPLTQASQYELHLGQNAYIDVQQAFINALLLDPTGNVVRVLAEELAAKGIPLLFVDVGGDYATLLGEFQLGWRICSPASQREGAIDPRAIPLDRDSNGEAQHVGQAILQEGWQVLFQFSSYASPIDAAVTLWDVVQGMRDWGKTQQSRSGRRLPSVIFITDAYKFCSDTDKHSVFREIPDVAQAVRNNVVNGLRARGRDGLYWYLGTRKLTGMEKQILGECAWMVHQPPVVEVQSGWVSAYTGHKPPELQRIPQTHTLILILQPDRHS